MKGMDVDRLVNHTNKAISTTSTQEEEFTTEDLIIESILAGLGKTVVEDVITPRRRRASPTTTNGIGNTTNIFSRNHSTSSMVYSLNLEEEEVHRNKVIIDHVANLVETGLPGTYTSLENDLFRMMLLESFGGSSRSDGNESGGARPSQQQQQQGGGGGGSNESESSVMLSTTREEKQQLLPFGLSKRHYQTLQRRLKKPVQPVVRALCAYAGGFGEMLIRCTKENSNNKASSLSFSNQWYFPSCLSTSV